MLVIRQVLGNVREDLLWGTRSEAARAANKLDTVMVEPRDVEKRRLRAVSSFGVELGIALDSGQNLRNGDVLEYDPDSGEMMVVGLSGQRLLVLTIEDGEPDEIVERGIRLGHALGNQHWPAVVDGRRVEVPVQIDESVVSTVLESHNLDGVTYEFVDAEGTEGPNLPTEGSHYHA